MNKHDSLIHHQINLIKAQGPSLATYSQIHPSIHQPTALAQQHITLLVTDFVRSVGDGPNANLKAFIIVMLKLVFEKKTKPHIIQKIKSTLYEESFDMKQVYNFTNGELSNIQMKKLLVQFFQLLNYGKEDYKVENRIIKYPIVLEILVLFLKNILISSINQSSDYQANLSTSNSYAHLSSFFSIHYTNFLGIYLFSQDGYFISTHNYSQFLYGSFSQSQVQQQNILTPHQQQRTEGVFLPQKHKVPKISFGRTDENYFVIQKSPSETNESSIIEKTQLKQQDNNSSHNSTSKYMKITKKKQSHKINHIQQNRVKSNDKNQIRLSNTKTNDHQSTSECLCIFQKKSKIKLNSQMVNIKWVPTYQSKNNTNSLLPDENRCKIRSDYSRIPKQPQKQSMVQFRVNNNCISSITHHEHKIVFRQQPFCRDISNQKINHLTNMRSSIIINQGASNFNSPRPMHYIIKR